MSDGSSYGKVTIRHPSGDGDTGEGPTISFPTPEGSETYTHVRPLDDSVVVRLHSDGSGELIELKP